MSAEVIVINIICGSPRLQDFFLKNTLRLFKILVANFEAFWFIFRYVRLMEFSLPCFDWECNEMVRIGGWWLLVSAISFHILL